MSSSWAEWTDADGVIIALSVGSNVITVEVTAEDGQTTKTYTATVTRATASAANDGRTFHRRPPRELPNPVIQSQATLPWPSVHQ